MFIIESDMSEETTQLLAEVEQQFGLMPPHWKLFASLNPTRFKMFMEEIAYLVNHPHIQSDFFAFLRLFVASKEEFSYCKSFNRALLLARGYSKEALETYLTDISKMPLDAAHRTLAAGVYKAIYFPQEFTREEIEKLKSLGWSNEDIFDAIDHGAFLFKFSRILKAYLS